MVTFQKKVLISLGLLSASIIAFQLVLMQIFSIVQWYHFAYMVISVALLGFGAAGTFLSIFRKWLLDRFDVVLPLTMFLAGISMSVVVVISQLNFFRFDSLLLFSDYASIYKLFLTYLLFIIPFFLGALPIGLIFTNYVDYIGRLYFVNLIGSGAGGIFVVIMFWVIFPNVLPAVIALLPIISGVIAIQEQSKRKLLILAFVSVIIVSTYIINPPHLVLSEFKSMSKTLNLPDSEITKRKCSPFGLVEVVSAPTIRYAPGLSLAYKNTIPVKSAVFVNGDWFGPIMSWKSTDTISIMDYTTNALPYTFGKKERVLILNAGTGGEIILALRNDAKEIIAIEPNPVITELLEKELADEVDSLFNNPFVRIKSTESRTYLLTDTSKYELIVLPVVGSFGGTSGLFALKEQFEFTKEAFSEMWEKLNKDGIISVTCWLDYPVRNTLKALSTITEVLEEQGVMNLTEHIAAVKSWGTITFTVKKSPINLNERDQIREFCSRLMFDPVMLPDLKSGEKEKYNKLQDEHFFKYLDEIISSKRMMFYSDYDFNIEPATDDKPYFSQFIRWKSIPNLKEQFGNNAIPFFEIGYVIVILTFVQITIAAIVLILLPLFKIGWKGGNKFWTLIYFSGIGLGYMFVEIVFIQRFILYFGNPIYSAAFVISVMLILSGVGSYISSRLEINRKTFLSVTAIITILLLLYSLVLTGALQCTIAYPFSLKILFAVLFMIPVSVFMGMPFPIGLSFVSLRDKNSVPWAWGINGCVSVISAVLAVIISVELGFTWVMVIASFAYLLALSVNIKKVV